MLYEVITDWAKAEVVTVITDQFKKSGGPVVDYVNTRNWDNATVNELLSWMQNNQANGEDGAIHFLKNYPKVWTRSGPPGSVSMPSLITMSTRRTCGLAPLGSVITSYSIHYTKLYD